MTDQPFEPIEALIDGYLDATLTEAQHAQLFSALESDRALLKRFAQLTEFDAICREHAGHSIEAELLRNQMLPLVADAHGQAAAKDLLQELADFEAGLEVEPPLPPIHLDAQALTRQKYMAALSFVLRHTFTPKRVAMLATAAAVLLGVVLGIVLLSGPDEGGLFTNEPEHRDLPIVATLVRTHRAQWVGQSPKADGSMSAGEMALISGFAEMEFQDGARVIVQAPASFELLDGNKMALYRGRLVSEVPVAAHGFTIDTPAGRVVDLGTEFAVAVWGDGKGRSVTHTQVYVGKVEMSALVNDQDQSVPQLIRAGEALQATSGESGLIATASRPEAFIRPRDLAELTAIDKDSVSRQRWIRSFELAQRTDVVAFYGISPDAVDLSRLVNRSWHGQAIVTDGSIVNATPTESRTVGEQALQFDANDSYVQIKCEREMSAITLAAWVRTDTKNQPYMAILNSDGFLGRGRLHWQFVDDHLQLALGRLAQESGVALDEQRVHVLSESPVDWADGAWQFVAVSVDSDSGAVEMYINGDIVAKEQIDFHVPIDLSSARIGGWAPWEGSTDKDRSFHGEIDELLIFDRALNEREVRELYQGGTLNDAPEGDTRAQSTHRPSALPFVGPHQCLVSYGVSPSWWTLHGSLIPDGVTFSHSLLKGESS